MTTPEDAWDDRGVVHHLPLADSSVPGASSWAPIDLGPYIDGTYQPVEPGVLFRSDGAGLLYAGTVSWLQGESESMKSWVAQIAIVETIKAGHDALLIDYESSAAEVVARLMQLGATPAQLSRLLYVRPTEPAASLAASTDFHALLEQTFAIAVVDGVTDALGTEGKSLLDNQEVASWMRTVLRPLAEHTGAAVVCIDHVVKSQDGRGRFAIGAQSKMAGLSGVAYLVEPKTVLGRGLRGEVILRVAKDRPGAVRSRSGEYRAGDRTQETARVVIDATTKNYTYRIYAPDTAITDGRTAHERCADALEQLDVDPESGRRSIDSLLRAHGYAFGPNTIQAAIKARKEVVSRYHEGERSPSGIEDPHLQ